MDLDRSPARDLRVGYSDRTEKDPGNHESWGSGVRGIMGNLSEGVVTLSGVSCDHFRSCLTDPL